MVTGLYLNSSNDSMYNFIMSLESEQGRRMGSMGSRALMRYAKKWGVETVTIGHRHAKHLVSPDGEHLSFPYHGGNRQFATGTFRIIMDFIHTHGSER